ncbi:MAG: C_GCAxxG_C_C family protein [Treponema sp.]|jgi:C_GCAxxG_C_C family probable redox protein|nr:C_GCAxxG_C_C family protein [Treponema sp.]
MEQSEIAASLLLKGYNCAQSVVYAFCDDLHIDKEMAMKAATGFGAGMGRKEEVCGAVSGAIMVIGMKYGRAENQDRSLTEQTYQKTHALMDRFREKQGSFICRNLLNGCDLSTEEGRKEFKEKNLIENVCKPCVINAVEILKDLL